MKQFSRDNALKHLLTTILLFICTNVLAGEYNFTYNFNGVEYLMNTKLREAYANGVSKTNPATDITIQSSLTLTGAQIKELMGFTTQRDVLDDHKVGSYIENNKDYTFKVVQILQGFSKSNITSIQLVDDITSLPIIAFKDCKKLRSVKLSSKLTAISSSAFAGCTSLSSITIPESVEKIGNSAFEGCTSLGSVRLGNNLKTIDVGAFDGCTSLTNISIPESVEEIGGWAFNNCKSLGAIQLPSKLKTIGELTFRESGVTRVTFANGQDAALESIEKQAFYRCEKLESFQFPKGLKTIGDMAFSGTKKLKSAELPNSVTSIGEAVFSTSGIEELVLSDGLKQLSSDAFSGCNSLKSITFGENTQLTSLGNSGINWCNNLRDVYVLMQNPFDTGNDIFSNETYRLGTLHVPAGLTEKYENTYCWGLFHTIKDNAVVSSGTTTPVTDPTELNDGDVFTAKTVEGIELLFTVISAKDKTAMVGNPNGINARCAINMENWKYPFPDSDLTIPDHVNGYTVTEIGREGLSGVHVREGHSIILPNTLTKIGNDALSGVLSESIILPDGITTIGDGAFSGAEIGSITLPGNLSNIGEDIFRWSRLQDVIFPAGLTTIPNFLFSHSNIRKIDIPNTITEIGACAFSNCDYLEQVTIPSSVTSIGDGAFSTCWSLSSIEIPGSVKHIGGGTFYECVQLQTIKICEGVETIVGGAFGHLEEFSVEIPSSATMEDRAFSGIIKKLTFNDGVKRINMRAFTNAIIDAEWGKDGHDIYHGEIYCLSKVPPRILGGRLTLDCMTEEDVNDIMDEVYPAYQMTQAKVFVPAEALKSYQEDVFWGRCNLCAIGGYQESQEHADDEIFGTDVDGTWMVFRVLSNEDKTVQVGSSNKEFSLSGTDTAVNWETASGVITIPSEVHGYKVTSIASGAFLKCAGVTEVVIPSTVTSIGTNAFMQSGVTTVTIPESVKTIGQSVFYGCENLTRYEWPHWISVIPEQAFNRCKNLTEIIIPEGVTDIEEMAFGKCAFTSVTLPSTLKSIGGYAFQCSNVYCKVTDPTELSQNAFPTSVSGSSNHRFYYYFGTLYVPKGCKEKYRNTDTWNWFSAITEADYNSGIVKPKNYYAVYADGTLSFYFDENMESRTGTIYSESNWRTTSDNGWSEHCNDITKVVFDKSFVDMSPNQLGVMFMNCSSLTSIEGIENLNTEHSTRMSYMFKDCSSLKSIDLSSFDTRHVTEMGSMFNNCSSLETIYVGDRWSTEILANGNSMFYKCTKLVGGAGTKYNANFYKKSYDDYTYAHVDGGEDNPGYFTYSKAPVDPENLKAGDTFTATTKDGVEMMITLQSAKDKTVLIGPDNSGKTWLNAESAIDPTTGGTLVIPAVIDGYTVTGVSDYAFWNCSNITEVVLPKGLKTIGKYAFANCKLSSVTLPSTLTSIGSQAFAYKNLESIYCLATEPFVLDDKVFTYSNYQIVGGDGTTYYYYTGKLYVPTGSKEKYAQTPSWDRFMDNGDRISEMDFEPEEENFIESGATFETQNGNTAVYTGDDKATGIYTIPETVTHGGNTYTVTEIAPDAFKDNTSLTQVTIPGTVTTIGAGAFAGCANLTAIYILSPTPVSMSVAEARNMAHRADGTSISQFDGIDFETCVLYVPYGSEEAYRKAEGWSLFKNIVGEHSCLDHAVTIKAQNYTRMYGEENPVFEFTTEGAELDGEPAMECNATIASGVGTYDIIIGRGSVQNYNTTYVTGTLTVTPSPLTIAVNDAERTQGEENPEFILTYQGWKNGDDESVLTTKPVVTTSATVQSPAGEYSINVSGAAAENYDINYQSGTLTVIESSGIEDVKPFERPRTEGVFDLQGRKMRSDATNILPKGVYIINGRKVIK